MSLADTIRALLRARMNEAEVMAALGVEREYVRLVKMRPSRKDVSKYRVDPRVSGISSDSRVG